MPITSAPRPAPHVGHQRSNACDWPGCRQRAPMRIETKNVRVIMTSIGMRGAGNVSWTWLNATYPTYYPLAKLGTAALQQAAVQKTCSTGSLWDYSGSASNPTKVTSTESVSSITSARSSDSWS